MTNRINRFLFSILGPRVNAVAMKKAGFKTVAVEGNIASGKTECLRFFQDRYGVKALAEPVEKWRDCSGHNLLDLMYSDPSRWSLTFQTYVQLTMLQAHTAFEPDEVLGDVKFMERSIFSAKYCFVENLYQSKKMPEVEYLVLTEWFNWIIDNADCNVDLIVYLRTSPEVVYERLIRRSRPEERCVSLEYLQALHNLHEEWLINRKFPVTGKVIEIDANADLKEMHSRYESLATENIFTDAEGRIVMNERV